MNAKCKDNRGEFKRCPYRVLSQETGESPKGTFVSQRFYQCEGEGCIAYHVGICLRAYEALSKLEDNRDGC